MIVYHFTSSEFALRALRDHRLKIARINELNDPFEFCVKDLSDIDTRINGSDLIAYLQWNKSRIENFKS